MHSPPDGETHSYPAADGTIPTYRAFASPSAQTIVLCHGLAAGGMQFAANARYFAAAGYRVLVPDLRGHGRSATALATAIRPAGPTLRAGP